MLTQPVIHPEIGCKVPNKHVHPTVLLAKRKQYATCYHQAQVRQQDQFGVLGFIQWACRIEMVHATTNAIGFASAATFTLSLMIVVAGDVANEIPWPPTDLL